VTPPATLAGTGRFVASAWRAWRYVWQAAPGLTAASLALAVAQGMLPIAALVLLKRIVDAIAAAANGGGAAALQPAFVLIALGAALALLTAAVNGLAGVAGEAHAQRVADHMHDVLHAKSIELDLEYYENPQYYDTLHRAQQEAPYRPIHIAKSLVAIFQHGLSLLAMAALLVSLHWSLALIVLVAVAPEVLVHLKFANDLYAWRRRRTVTERYAQYYDWMMTGPLHAQELRLFDLGGLFLRKFRDLRELLRRERLSMLARRSGIEFGAQSAAIAAMFGAYAFIAWRTVQGGLSLGGLVMYFQAFQRGQESLRQLLRAGAGLYEDHLFLANLYAFLDLERKVAEPARPAPVPRPMRKGIAFEHVSFGYGDKSVLHDVSLEIPAGATVALVGENGSGKTTLIKLLARLYDPQSGRITVDGIDLRDFATADLRRQTSVIFQDYVRYNLTARENIWFGNVESDPDASRIQAAADHAGAGDVIRKLPRGLDTVLGRWFEDGSELSVGEWQKIALARALLREAQVIVLDEPTSAMDAKAEYELFERFHALAAGRTAILISHRLSTVKMADRIYVLRAGRIVESGTHAELVGRSGAYARLFAAQASGYR
jgi:ATP-binding cassette subfamily B protein